MRVFIQIGTNDGRDDFNRLVKVVRPDRIILIEPNSIHNKSIRESYREVSNVYIENVAITTAPGNVKLQHPRNFDGKARNGIQYSDSHFSLLPMKDWGKELDTIEVQGMTFMDLCKKYKVNHVEYLQIDTEGFDGKIIKSIDFGKVSISSIRYEYWDFAQECFEEDQGTCGRDEMMEVSKYLEGLGYFITPLKGDMIATKR